MLDEDNIGFGTAVYQLLLRTKRSKFEARRVGRQFAKLAGVAVDTRTIAIYIDQLNHGMTFCSLRLPARVRIESGIGWLPRNQLTAMAAPIVIPHPTSP